MPGFSYHFYFKNAFVLYRIHTVNMFRLNNKCHVAIIKGSLPTAGLQSSNSPVKCQYNKELKQMLNVTRCVITLFHLRLQSKILFLFSYWLVAADYQSQNSLSRLITTAVMPVGGSNRLTTVASHSCDRWTQQLHLHAVGLTTDRERPYHVIGKDT